MKSTSIKSVKQLPSWFNIKNYEKAKYFEAGEWYDELMQRLYLRHCLKHYGKGPLDIPLNWEFIKRDGLLFFVAKNEEVKFRVSALTPALHEIRPLAEKPPLGEQEFASVNSLNNFYMYGCYWLDLQHNQAAIAKRMKIWLEEYDGKVTKEMLAEVENWLFKPFDYFPPDIVLRVENKFGYAKIDLDASDEQIKKDFSTWLARERTRRNRPAPKKNFNQVDFDGWYESAVLPYLDLMFWSELEDIKINQYVIAQAIFPDAYSLGSDVDPLGKLKTTKKKAEYLMDHKTMKLLELQISD